MSNLKRKITISFLANKTLQFFLRGLIAIVPIAVTIYVVLWLFTTIDNILPSIIHAVFPKNEIHENEMITRPGFNFVITIILVIAIGWVSSLFFITPILSIVDRLLEKTPGVKFIYSSVKDFLQAFAGNKKKFDKPVLVNVDASDVWRVGFITQPNASHFDLPEHLVVYVPHSYAVSGITYIVPKDRVKLLTHTTPADVMKFAISGGVTEVGFVGHSGNSIY